MSARREFPGVRILDPVRIWIEPEVEIGAESVLYPDVALLGRTVVGRGCTLHQGAWLRDTLLGDGCRVGPFARLRPGTVLERNVRVGNFVEVKQSRLGEGAKANHLAYLGDARVGAGANIGAGVVTCNYDGVDKHPTTIGRGAFVGSDTMLVAPVRVGDEATTAAGSVITQDVEDGALAVGRSKQRNIPGWAARRTKVGKKKKES